MFLWCRSVCVAEQVTGVFSVLKRLLESVSRKREVAVKRIRALEKTLAEKGTENERERAAHEEREIETLLAVGGLDRGVLRLRFSLLGLAYMAMERMRTERYTRGGRGSDGCPRRRWCSAPGACTLLCAPCTIACGQGRRPRVVQARVVRGVAASLWRAEGG